MANEISDVCLFEVLTPTGVKPGWITPDGKFFTNKDLDTVSHIDAVDQNPELFDIPQGEMVLSKDEAMENGAIRLATEGVAYINPSEEAFQKLRKILRNNSNRTSIFIDDQKRTTTYTVPKKLITRSLSLDKFIDRLKERALIEKYLSGEVSTDLFIESFVTDNVKKKKNALRKAGEQIEGAVLWDIQFIDNPNRTIVAGLIVDNAKGSNKEAEIKIMKSFQGGGTKIIIGLRNSDKEEEKEIPDPDMKKVTSYITRKIEELFQR